MSTTRILAIFRKEVIQIRRDRRSFFVVVLMPVAMMLLFGYGVTLDIKQLPVYVLDREGSAASRDFLARFEASEYFNVARYVSDYAALTRALDAGACRMALVVPHDFSQQLHAGGAVSVQALVDASDDNTASLAIGYAQAVVRSYSQEVQVEWLERRGRRALEPAISVESRTWFNEDLESRAFIIPGVVALVMAVVGTFVTSLTIAREWERGTMEQLISTPVKPLEIMAGKLAPYFVIGIFDVALSAAMAVWWFGVPFRGRMGTLFASSALFLVVVLAMGYLISVVAKSQLAASQMALVATFMPTFLLSGFLFALEQMPAFIQGISHAVPARYYMVILKSVFLKGSPLELLRAEMASLALFALVVGALATRAFHKRLG